jgi:hypothetical protein
MFVYRSKYFVPSTRNAVVSPVQPFESRFLDVSFFLQKLRQNLTRVQDESEAFLFGGEVEDRYGNRSLFEESKLCISNNFFQLSVGIESTSKSYE